MSDASKPDVIWIATNSLGQHYYVDSIDHVREYHRGSATPFVLKSAYDQAIKERDEALAKRDEWYKLCIEKDKRMAGYILERDAARAEVERLKAADEWNVENIKRLSCELTAERAKVARLREAVIDMIKQCDFASEILTLTHPELSNVEMDTITTRQYMIWSRSAKSDAVERARQALEETKE